MFTYEICSCAWVKLGSPSTHFSCPFAQEFLLETIFMATPVSLFSYPFFTNDWRVPTFQLPRNFQLEICFTTTPVSLWLSWFVLGYFFFFFITLKPRVEWCKSLCALNTIPPRNRFTSVLGYPVVNHVRNQYGGTSLIRNCLLLGPYSRTMPRTLWWPRGGRRFLISEVPL